MNQIHPTREPCPQRRPIGIDWDASPLRECLGAYSDGVLARLLGCAAESVLFARRRRGIPACPRSRARLRPPESEAAALRGMTSMSGSPPALA